MPPHGRERKPHYRASDHGTEAAANPRLWIASPSQGVLRHRLPFSPRQRAPLPLGRSLSEPLYATTLTGEDPQKHEAAEDLHCRDAYRTRMELATRVKGSRRG
jgi:hypothetical protein